MPILLVLISVFLILNIFIFYLPKFLDKTFSLLFGKSPSRKNMAFKLGIDGTTIFLTIFKLYIEIDSIIKYRIQSEEYV